MNNYMYCVNCGKTKLTVSNGTNGSDYIVCDKCGISYNIFFDDREDAISCDNTSCEGDCEDIKPVKMRKEFDGGWFNWCEDCRTRDKDMMAKIK